MSEELAKCDFFGYLPCDWIIEFNGGRISPIAEFDKVTTWVAKSTNQDGFIYPPIERQMKWDMSTKKYLGEVPKSKRPALLHRIPASHKLCLYSLGEAEDIRKGLGSLIIHLLAYLFGVRLQFFDWWFDGRVPTKSTHNVHFTKETVENFISHCYQTWSNWDEEEKKLIINVLYMHSRVPSYEWDWEQFMIEYMVLDGCYNLAKRLHGFVAKKHQDRIKTLCQKFGIPLKEELISDIVQLRNDLFHETFWDRSLPCTASSDSAFMSSYHLRRLNQRLIPALFAYNTPYVKTKWWHFGTFSFK